MSDVVNDFFKRYYPTDLTEDDFEYTPVLGGMRRLKHRTKTRNPIFPRMECADGFTMSVQGHGGAYSHPRDDFADHYTMVEVGFPSEREELLMPFVEDKSNPTDTVYGYVPIAIIEQVITKHGGLVP